MSRKHRKPQPSDTPVFDSLGGVAHLRSKNASWRQARRTADKRLAAALVRPTTPPTAEQREAIAEQHGWF